MWPRAAAVRGLRVGDPVRVKMVTLNMTSEVLVLVNVVSDAV